MTAESSSESVGTRLREAREKRGVSLRGVAEATKISIGALEALERSDISRLPGGIFTRAFVRSYAIEVGLDPEKTIDDFMAQFPQDSVTAGHPASIRVDDDERFDDRRRTASVFVKLAAVGIAVALLVFYFGAIRRSISPPADPAAVASTTTPNEIAPPPQTGLPAASAAATPPSMGTTATNGTPENSQVAEIDEPPLTPHPADASEHLAIGLAVRARCWVSVVSDGRRAIQRELQPGEYHTFEVKSDFVVTTGNAGAIVLTINGMEAKPLGKPGEVVTKRLNLANYKTYLTP